MAENSHIEWTGATWNPLVGCALESPGCKNCYAMRMAHRIGGKDGSKYTGLTVLGNNGVRWNGDSRIDEKALLEPFKYRKPKTIFVCSMSDLFYEGMEDEWIDKVFAVMALLPQHTFQILTKRADRMSQYLNHLSTPSRIVARADRMWNPDTCDAPLHVDWPMKHVWLGVSVESQEYAEKRIPLLLDTPAAKRWISAEPLLSDVDLTPYLPAWHGMTHDSPGIDWVVVGGESGSGARPFHLNWGRRIVRDCKAANVPVFVKQLGAVPIAGATIPFPSTDPKGGDFENWPTDLQVREMPA